jgi:hypothetical protein
MARAIYIFLILLLFSPTIGTRSEADDVIAPTRVAAAQQNGHAATAGVTAHAREHARAEFASVFDCVGEIRHQSYHGGLESPLEFWFGVRGDGRVDGFVTEIGAPLDLPRRALSGKLSPHFNHDGVFTGGEMVVNWPFADARRPVELALMREVFIRSGYHVNGVGKILRRTSKHTYIAGSLWFDPKSHPTLSTFYRVSFIAATCYPETDLPTTALAN